jgi:hypothetical protein
MIFGKFDERGVGARPEPRPERKPQPVTTERPGE